MTEKLLTGTLSLNTTNQRNWQPALGREWRITMKQRMFCWTGGSNLRPSEYRADVHLMEIPGWVIYYRIFTFLISIPNIFHQMCLKDQYFHKCEARVIMIMFSKHQMKYVCYIKVNFLFNYFFTCWCEMILAAAWQNQQNHLCAQRSSDQPGHSPSLINLCCLHKEILDP